MGLSLHSYGHHHSHGGKKKTKIISRNRADYEKLTITGENIQTSNGYTSYGTLPDGEHSYETGHQETSHRKDNINVKAAFVHVLGDLLQSVGVLVAAFIIYFKVSS